MYAYYMKTLHTNHYTCNESKCSRSSHFDIREYKQLKKLLINKKKNVVAFENWILHVIIQFRWQFLEGVSCRMINKNWRAQGKNSLIDY